MAKCIYSTKNKDLIMKRMSYPPLIIFLDVLFIFLFIFFLNSSHIVKIDLPKGNLFDGAQIVYKKQGEYYTLNNAVYLADRSFVYLGKCSNEIKECTEAYSKYNQDEVFIVYPEKLQESISNLSLLALGNNLCKKVDFIVNYDGNLEYEKMLEKNTCLLKIKDYEKFSKQ